MSEQHLVQQFASANVATDGAAQRAGDSSLAGSFVNEATGREKRDLRSMVGRNRMVFGATLSAPMAFASVSSLMKHGGGGLARISP